MLLLLFTGQHIPTRLYCCPRPNFSRNAKRGGVIVYHKSNYDKYISLVETNSNGYRWFKVSKEILYNSQDAYICVCYVPPEDSNVFRNADSPLHAFCFFSTDCVLMYANIVIVAMYT